MNNQHNYDMLGLQPGCSEEDIKRAYIILAKKYHPDKAQEQTPETEFKNFVGIHKAYSEMTEDLRHRKEEKSRKFQNYMNYVNTIIDIFNDSDDSEEPLNDQYFKNQQQSMERACHKIMKVLPHACKDSLKAPTEASNEERETSLPIVRNTSGDTNPPSSMEAESNNEQKLPTQQEITKLVRRKKKIFKVYRCRR